MPTPELPTRTRSRHVDVATLMGSASVKDDDDFSDRVTASPTPAFLLRHWPANWDVSTTLKIPTLLPEITPHVLAPGVNGVRTRGRRDRKPADAYRTSVRDHTDKGWIYIDPVPLPAKFLPGEVPPGYYIRGVPCQTKIGEIPGTKHVEAWYVPQATLPNEDQRFKFDRRSYELWLVHLVESGQVPECLDYVAERKLRHYQDRAGAVQRLHRVGNASDKRLEDAEVRAAQAQVAIDRLFGGEPDPPAPPVKPVSTATKPKRGR